MENLPEDSEIQDLINSENVDPHNRNPNYGLNPSVFWSNRNRPEQSPWEKTIPVREPDPQNLVATPAVESAARSILRGGAEYMSSSIPEEFRSPRIEAWLQSQPDITEREQEKLNTLKEQTSWTDQESDEYKSLEEKEANVQLKERLPKVIETLLKKGFSLGYATEDFGLLKMKVPDSDEKRRVLEDQIREAIKNGNLLALRLGVSCVEGETRIKINTLNAAQDHAVTPYQKNRIDRELQRLHEERAIINMAEMPLLTRFVGTDTKLSRPSMYEDWEEILDFPPVQELP